MNRVLKYVRADPQEMSAHQISVFIFTGALLALGGLAALAWLAGPGGCWQYLRHARWAWMGLAPVALIVSHVGYTAAYREVARVEDGPTLGTGDATALVVAGFGPFNPRGGFASDTRGLASHDSDQERALLRVMVLSVLEYAVLAPAALVAAVWMLADHVAADPGLVRSWVIGVPAGALLTGAVWRLHRRFGHRHRVLIAGGRGIDAIRITLRMSASWPEGTLAWAAMALYWAGEIALLGICMDVFAPHHFSVGAAILAYASGYALTRRTLPLAGAGPVEVLLPLALVWVSYPLAAAVAAVAAYRLFNLWLTIPPAALALRRLRRQPGGATPEEQLAERDRFLLRRLPSLLGRRRRRQASAHGHRPGGVANPLAP